METSDEILYRLKLLEVNMSFYKAQEVQDILDFFEKNKNTTVQLYGKDLLINIKDVFVTKMQGSYTNDNDSQKESIHNHFIDKLKDMNKLFSLDDLIFENIHKINNRLYLNSFKLSKKLKNKEISVFKELCESLNTGTKSYKNFLLKENKITDESKGTLHYIDLLSKKNLLTGPIFLKFLDITELKVNDFFSKSINFIDEKHIKSVQDECNYKHFQMLLENLSYKSNHNFLEKIYINNDKNVYTSIFGSDILINFLVTNQYKEFLFKPFSDKINNKSLEMFEKLVVYYDKNLGQKQLFEELSNSNILEKIKLNKSISPYIKNFILENSLNESSNSSSKRMKI